MTNLLIETARRELYQYTRVRPGLVLKSLIYASAVLTLLTSALSIYALANPIVVYEGLVLRGYISPLHYSLYVENRAVNYPHLDSVITISWLTLAYTTAVIALTAYALLGYKWWRTRSTLALLAVSTISAYMLLGLVYSILRVLAFDIVPGLPATTYAAVIGGRLILDPPKTTYTWTHQLSRNPLFLAILSIALFLLGASLLLALALTPRLPVSPVKKIPKKAVLARNLASEK